MIKLYDFEVEGYMGLDRVGIEIEKRGLKNIINIEAIRNTNTFQSRWDVRVWYREARPDDSFPVAADYLEERGHLEAANCLRKA